MTFFIYPGFLLRRLIFYRVLKEGKSHRTFSMDAKFSGKLTFFLVSYPNPLNDVQSSIERWLLDLLVACIKPLQDGVLQGCFRIGKGVVFAYIPAFLQCGTYVLQERNQVQLYLRLKGFKIYTNCKTFSAIFADICIFCLKSFFVMPIYFFDSCIKSDM